MQADIAAWKESDQENESMAVVGRKGKSRMLVEVRGQAHDKAAWPGVADRVFKCPTSLFAFFE